LALASGRWSCTLREEPRGLPFFFFFLPSTSTEYRDYGRESTTPSLPFSSTRLLIRTRGRGCSPFPLFPFFLLLRSRRDCSARFPPFPTSAEVGSRRLPSSSSFCYRDGTAQVNWEPSFRLFLLSESMGCHGILFFPLNRNFDGIDVLSFPSAKPETGIDSSACVFPSSSGDSPSFFFFLSRDYAEESLCAPLFSGRATIEACPFFFRRRMPFPFFLSHYQSLAIGSKGVCN